MFSRIPGHDPAGPAARCGIMLCMRDWVGWHAAYDDPSSFLNVRLRKVQERLSEAIGAAPPGPVRLVSLCAGQGHDVIGVLPGHPRRDDVSAVLIESNPRNADLARRAAAQAGLPLVEVREADAAAVDSFADALPADVLLLCGIFGNVSDEDVKRTVEASAAMCAPGATVIWTRHRRPPDLTPRIRAWFAESGFDEVAFDALDTDWLMTVGANRLSRAGGGLPDRPLFTFRP
jgi:Putative methyltransferase